MKNLTWWLLLIISVVLSSCSPEQKDITVAVAANFLTTTQELVKEYEKTHPSVKVMLVPGSTGKLTSQILKGAPYDLFLAADMKRPLYLAREGKSEGEPVIYAKGILVVFSKKGLSSPELKSLVSPHIKTIAVANPKLAPYGDAAIKSLKNADLYTSLSKKIIYTETVTQSVHYGLTSADAAFIPYSALVKPAFKNYSKDKNWFPVKDVPVELLQGMVILKKKKEAVNFYNYILHNKEAAKIIQSFGYQLPGRRL